MKKYLAKFIVKKFLWGIAFFLISCSSVSYRDSNDIKGVPEWGPHEIGQTVSEMTQSLAGFLQSSGKKSPIELDKIKNNTTEHIDTGLLSNEISTNLIKKKIPFVDRTFRKEAMKEIADGQRGLISNDTILEAGNFQSPKYKLVGELNDNLNFDDGKKIQYLLITFRLINLETNAIDWQEQKRFIKVSHIEGYGF